ncbi:MAG: hypothetical protein ABSH07_11965 [Candidatus Dormibacteria bacterium]|jgi:hypothetical protein
MARDEIGMDEIRDLYLQRARAAGREHHFFDRQSNRFFGSRFPAVGYTGPGGIYFTESQQPPGGGARIFRVKRLNASGGMDTIDGPVGDVFHSWPSGAAAKAAARRLAAGGTARRRAVRYHRHPAHPYSHPAATRHRRR